METSAEQCSRIEAVLPVQRGNISLSTLQLVKAMSPEGTNRHGSGGKI
jgi:hypothetical protein